MNKTTLDVQDLAFGYNGSPLFEGVTFRLEVPACRGLVVAIVGPSGVGKSTLLRLLSGRSEQPTTGRVTITPSDAVAYYVPQEPILFGHLSLAENVAFHGRYGDLRKRFNQQDLKSGIETLRLEDLLADKARTIPETLSGGEKQRLSLARALAVRPNVLLLDEPCTGVDVCLKRDLLLQLRRVVDARKLMAFYVSHHPDEVQLIADQILYLDHPPGPNPSRSGHRTARARIMSIEQFLAAPPSLTALQLLEGTSLNVVYCTKSGGWIRLGTEVLCKWDPVLPDGQEMLDGEVALAFAGRTAQVTRMDGVRVDMIGGSDRYLLVSLGNGQTLTVPRTIELLGEAAWLTLAGRGHLFPAAGGAGRMVTLTPPPTGLSHDS